ncbi:MAG: AlwI family type II restriction endonuclease [Treponema sp.]|jgi:hypothetical protein|nr:AlwI family type II restriction endonuclease [Treponema sp.]
MARKKEYKPLLLTTTVRNPQRYKLLLNILYAYNGKVLDNDIIDKVVFDLISRKLYIPLYASQNLRLKGQLVDEDTPFSKDDTEEIIINSPQNHKEAGFDKGWPSRFDTWYKLAKELGFVYYKMDNPIEFSQSGVQLVKSIEQEFAHSENQVFLNAFVKYERNNPFRRVLNTNRPLILLLQTIQELKSVYGNESAGISRLEIPLLLCWRDNDYKALAALIRHIRAKYNFTPSNEVIYDQCKIALNITTTQGEKRFKKTNILREMPDEFIRKMRLTGLISIRGNGRFVDINTLEMEKIKYCLDHYTDVSAVFTTERAYFDYMKNIDANLVSIKSDVIYAITEKEKFFQKWVEVFSLEVLKEELFIVSNPRGNCKHEILKYISEPVRFEFLTALSLAKSYPELKVEANYIIDDEGLPTVFAPGGGADIICYDNYGNILFEVTLLTGTQQNIREMPAIHRHLEEIIKIAPDSFSVMLCPRAHSDTISYSKWLKDTKNLIVAVLETKTFITSLGANRNAREYSKI